LARSAPVDGHPPPRSSWIRTALWLGIVLVLVWFWSLRNSRIVLVEPEAAVAAAPLVLRDLEGRAVDIESYRGKVVVLNLWASWCGPCRSEIPGLSRIQRELGDEGLVVLGVNVEQLSASEIRRASEQLKIDYLVVVPETPLALNGNRLSAGMRAGDVLPYSWLIDRQGRIRAVHAGVLLESALRKSCRRLLEESG